jgi:hypothetical protein
MKPSIAFIINFYFAADNAYTKKPFASNPNFDHAYLQQQCDKVYAEQQFSVGKTKQYWNATDQKKLAQCVQSIYA